MHTKCILKSNIGDVKAIGAWCYSQDLCLWELIAGCTSAVAQCSAPLLYSVTLQLPAINSQGEFQQHLHFCTPSPALSWTGEPRPLWAPDPSKAVEHTRCPINPSSLPTHHIWPPGAAVPHHRPAVALRAWEPSWPPRGRCPRGGCGTGPCWPSCAGCGWFSGTASPSSCGHSARRTCLQSTRGERGALSDSAQIPPNSNHQPA